MYLEDVLFWEKKDQIFFIHVPHWIEKTQDLRLDSTAVRMLETHMTQTQENTPKIFFFSEPCLEKLFP